MRLLMDIYGADIDFIDQFPDNCSDGVKIVDFGDVEEAEICR